jgi:hypothetical protein
MLFLPPESRAALNDSANSVDVQIFRLRYSSSIEPERFRQAQWLNWCQVKKKPGPCGNERGYKRIVACFGQHLVMDWHSRSATIAGYAFTINKLFELRNYPIHANLAGKDNMMSKMVHTREREENIARH